MSKHVIISLSMAVRLVDFRAIELRSRKQKSSQNIFLKTTTTQSLRNSYGRSHYLKRHQLPFHRLPHMSCLVVVNCVLIKIFISKQHFIIHFS